MSSHITITKTQALGLREAVRPLSVIVLMPDSPIKALSLVLLHEKILLMLVEFETSACETEDLVLTRDDVLLINQALSSQDGDWAADVLKQSRRALYELKHGLLPAWAEDNARIHEMLNNTGSVADV